MSIVPNSEATAAIIRETSLDRETSAPIAIAWPTLGTDRLRDGLRLGLLLAVVHGNGRSRIGKRNRDGLPDAARTAGHQCNALVQSGHSPLPNS